MPRSITSIRELAVAARGRRAELGLSQEDVARRAHVSRQWVSEFEAGKPTAELQLAIRLLDALGLSLSLSADEPGGQTKSGVATRTVDLDDLLDRYRG